MTQIELNEIQEARDALANANTRHKEYINELSSELRFRLARCDHKNPDGSDVVRIQNARNEGPDLYCPICHKDLEWENRYAKQNPL